jgi:hypothetical protein
MIESKTEGRRRERRYRLRKLKNMKNALGEIEEKR